MNIPRDLKWKRLSPGKYRAFGDRHKYVIQRVDDEWFLQVSEMLTISDLGTDAKEDSALHRCGSKKSATDLARDLENSHAVQH